MSIGLCGPHRTGKSTLAKAYSMKSGVPFIQTGVSATFERLGLSPKKDYDFGTRLMIQNEILKDCAALYEAAGLMWITDRTPLDFMMYTLADVQRENVSNTDAAELEKYMERCYELTNRHFTSIVVVQPGIPLIEEEGKAPANSAYIEHLNAVVMGLIVSDKLECSHYYLPRDMLDLNLRVSAVGNAVARSATKHKQRMIETYGNNMMLH